jgi:4-amino-4-deoxy-L-arabinose transferase-like glycosyltransferase
MKKYTFVLLGISIFLLFLLTRLISLTTLPIFTDEAIYIRWAQIAANDANWRFISLTDGKQPMFVWIAMLLVKVINDPLFAGRFVSVLAGFGSLIGMFFLTSEIFNNKKIGLLASFIYVIYPFSLIYDRMALYDSLVAMFIIWSLYFEILLVRFRRLDLALILGMIIGGGMLTKSNTYFALILLPFSLLLLPFAKKTWKKLLGKWILLAGVSFVIANVMYTILRLSPYFHIIEEKNYVFIYPLQEWIRQPFAFFSSNFHALTEWSQVYLTLPFLVLVIASFFVSKAFWREKLLLVIWFFVPFLALSFFGRIIYPRFILFMTMPLLVLGSYGLYSLVLLSRKRVLQIIIPLVFLGTFVFNDYVILTNFAQANIPRSDKSQFLTSWASGAGVSETVSFLKEKAKDQKIYVATEGTFGLMPYALEIYLHNNPNVVIKGFWPVSDSIPSDIIEMSKVMPTYVVFYQECPQCKGIGFAPPQWSVTPVIQKERLDTTHYTLYQVNSKQ